MRWETWLAALVLSPVLPAQVPRFCEWQTLRAGYTESGGRAVRKTEANGVARVQRKAKRSNKNAHGYCTRTISSLVE